MDRRPGFRFSLFLFVIVEEKSRVGIIIPKSFVLTLRASTGWLLLSSQVFFILLPWLRQQPLTRNMIVWWQKGKINWPVKCFTVPAGKQHGLFHSHSSIKASHRTKPNVNRIVSILLSQGRAPEKGKIGKSANILNKYWNVSFFLWL